MKNKEGFRSADWETRTYHATNAIKILVMWINIYNSTRANHIFTWPYAWNYENYKYLGELEEEVSFR